MTVNDVMVIYDTRVVAGLISGVINIIIIY